MGPNIRCSEVQQTRARPRRQAGAGGSGLTSSQPYSNTTMIKSYVNQWASLHLDHIDLGRSTAHPRLKAVQRACTHVVTHRAGVGQGRPAPVSPGSAATPDPRPGTAVNGSPVRIGHRVRAATGLAAHSRRREQKQAGCSAQPGRTGTAGGEHARSKPAGSGQAVMNCGLLAPGWSSPLSPPPQLHGVCVCVCVRVGVGARRALLGRGANKYMQAAWAGVWHGKLSWASGGAMLARRTPHLEYE